MIVSGMWLVCCDIYLRFLLGFLLRSRCGYRTKPQHFHNLPSCGQSYFSVDRNRNRTATETATATVSASQNRNRSPDCTIPIVISLLKDVSKAWNKYSSLRALLVIRVVGATWVLAQAHSFLLVLKDLKALNAHKTQRHRKHEDFKKPNDSKDLKDSEGPKG